METYQYSLYVKYLFQLEHNILKFYNQKRILLEEQKEHLNKIDQLKKNQKQILDLFNLQSNNNKKNKNDLSLNLELKYENFFKDFEKSKFISKNKKYKRRK